MKFKYQARTQEGELQVGFVEAGNRDAATSILQSHNLFILELGQDKGPSFADRFNTFFNRVKQRDMIGFTRQFATLLGARLPLNTALKTLEGQTANKILRDGIRQMSEDVDSGLSLSQAMGRQGNIFPDYYIEMVRAAEVTGNLDEIAGFLADYAEKEGDLSGKVSSALIYPGIVVGLFIIVAGIILTVVFPSIGSVFAENNVPLPWYTQVLLAVGSFVSKWWIVLLVFVAFLGASSINYFGTEEGRSVLDEAKIRFPIAKKVFVPVIIARFGNAAALLIHGGVPIAQSLEIISHMTGNVLYRDVIHDIAEDVRSGKLLSESIASKGEFFPQLVYQMAAVGETTGKSEEMFRKLADIYLREADKTTANLVDLIQPILMIGLGLMVGLLFASVLIPIYNLTASIH